MSGGIRASCIIAFNARYGHALPYRPPVNLGIGVIVILNNLVLRLRGRLQVNALGHEINIC